MRTMESPSMKKREKLDKSNFKLQAKKTSLLLIGILVLLITGCDIQFYDTKQELLEGERIFAQQTNGSITEAVYQEAGYYSSNVLDTVVGAFVSDGQYNWVPEFTGNSNQPNKYFVHASNDWGKPSIAPVKVAIKEIGTDTASNMNFVILDVFGEGGEKVDGRTHVYGTSPSGNMLFFDLDYHKGNSFGLAGDSSSTIFGKYNLSDPSIFAHKDLKQLPLRSQDQAEEGVVGFLIQNTNNLSYYELELYSGEKLAANLIDKVEVFLTPLWPENATITGTNVTQTGVTLTWPLINTITGLTPEGYEIYQNDELIQTVPSNVNQYEVTELTGGTAYRFEVKAKYNGKIGKEGLSTQVTTEAISNFNVSFNVNGGSVIADQTVSNNGKATKPLTNPTKTGYTFAGWYTDNNYTTEFDFDNTPITGDTIIYVKWTINNSTSPGSGGGGSYTGPTSPTSTTDGKLTLPAGTAGEVSLENQIVITIPANATNKELKLTIEKLKESEQLLLTKNKVLASSIFEVLKNFSENFRNPVTLTLSFDPNSLKGNQKPVIFYYDETKKEWVEVGGRVNGNKVSVEVDHFTKYAVFAIGDEGSTNTPPTNTKPTDTSPTDTSPTINFSDILGHWAEANIKQAVESGIVKGYQEGTFMPNKTVTRAEFAVMLINALKPQVEATPLTFTDTAKIGSWAQNAVAQAVQAGMINGYKDGSFRPNAEITRAEMAVMIANALGRSIEANEATGFADDKDIPAWAKGSITFVKQAGIVQGKGANNFAPQDQTTRAEAVTVLLNMLALQGEFH
ncbi:hypothetical protein EBB07_22400 [Paenibacillaceae bacterium]|nr:hypothetical protein EBB07_22400 [Paenibacillaceae bacterium]